MDLLLSLDIQFYYIPTYILFQDTKEPQEYFNTYLRSVSTLL